MNKVLGALLIIGVIVAAVAAFNVWSDRRKSKQRAKERSLPKH